ncbi:MAG: hypothetical protein WDM81_08875 [Rhizomicrobium sp.]
MKFSRIGIERIVPLVAGALMVVPPAAERLAVGAMEPGIVGRIPRLGRRDRRRGHPVVEQDDAARILGAHRIEHGNGVRVVQVGAGFVLQNIADQRRMTAEGAHHGDAFGDHETLGEAIGFARGLFHHDAVRVDLGAVGQPAERELAAAGLHGAQQAQPVLRGEHVVPADIAMEAEAIETQRLGLGSLPFRRVRASATDRSGPNSPN